jgi:predicted flap endonuclease-1-like 5' DNA nuclease/predicted  nucleic acid-binding Zn-ribbon protein
MPDIDIIHIVLLVAVTIAGVVAGWILRGNRAEQEKAAVSGGWQQQIEAQRREHERLLDQNKSLMEQISQYQASNADAKNRAKELSSALREAFERRDELQREIKDIRSNLEVTLSQRDQLQSDIASRGTDEEMLRQKDARIETLSQELASWQARLPPLIERYRVRNEEAERLEKALEQARQRISDLESERDDSSAAETRIEPVHHPEELTDGLDASNDPADDYVDEVDDDDLADDETNDPADDYVDEGDDDDLADDEANDLVEEFVDEVRDEELPPMPANETAHDSVGAGPGRREDLQQIKGVGPAIEKTLNELGIFNLRQIADMSEYDIDRVARKLKGFHSRIYREDWIGQARALLSQSARA